MAVVLPLSRILDDDSPHSHPSLPAVGDMTLTELMAKLPIVLGGLGLAALGVKVDEKKGK
ncbi:MAG: hypothetical protein WD852_11200 [Methyloceanibacter sp.]